MENGMKSEKENEKKAPGILIFAGTTEGRMLAEYVSAYNRRPGESAKARRPEKKYIPCYVSTATEYGKTVLDGLPGVTVTAGRMDSRKMKDFIEEKQIALVIDATHPFAGEATDNIKKACAGTAGVSYVRCQRQCPAENGGSKKPQTVWVDSVQEAAEYLKNTRGNILITTGSKELHLYTEIPGYKTRCFARVLSTREAVEESVRLGFEGRHLFAMQGPFSEEMNTALLRQIKASWIVTKESGTAGGYEDKIKAARAAGAAAVVVGRPQEHGETVQNVMEMIKKFLATSGFV